MNTEQTSENIFTYSTLKILTYVKLNLQKKTTALISMPNGKSSRHDGLAKEFYEYFWDDLKLYFIDFLKPAQIDGRLSIFQRQAIRKLILKKKNDKRFVKN